MQEIFLSEVLRAASGRMVLDLDEPKIVFGSTILTRDTDLLVGDLYIDSSNSGLPYLQLIFTHPKPGLDFITDKSTLREREYQRVQLPILDLGEININLQVLHRRGHAFQWQFSVMNADKSSDLFVRLDEYFSRGTILRDYSLPPNRVQCIRLSRADIESSINYHDERSKSFFVSFIDP